MASSSPAPLLSGGEGESGNVLSLLGFIKQYAPNLKLAESSVTWIQLTPRLREMLVLPLSTCRVAHHVTYAECREPVPSIVDDAVWTLVQRRERLKRQRRQRRGTGAEGGVTAASGTAALSPHSSRTDPDITPSFFLEGKNALTHGFIASQEGDDLSATFGGTTSRMRLGVACTHPNESVAFWKSSPVVRQLHVIVGDEMLRTMLLQTRVMLPLSTASKIDKSMLPPRRGRDEGTSEERIDFRGNYLLLCGPPLNAASRSLRAERALDSSKRKRCGKDMARFCESDGIVLEVRHPKPKKRRRRNIVRPAATAGPVTVSATILRHQSKKMGPNDSISRFPLFYFDSYIPRVGLPKSHAFEQCRSQQGLFEVLLKSTFDLGLQNKNKQRSLRKRLIRRFPTICDGILQGHKRCDYARILERYCSVPFSKGPVQNDEDSHSLARLAQAFTPRDHVASFLGAILRRVFPLEFWGSQGNFASMLASVHAFVHLRRKERMANKCIMEGIRITKMKWLYDASGPTDLHGNNRGIKPHRYKNPRQRSNHEAVSRLSLQVLRWVFRGFIIPLLRSNFYVTETEFSAQQIQYYRKPIWSRFRSLALKKLLLKQNQHHQEHFAKVSFTETRNILLANARQMGLSRLRLLPKSTGVRPIAQLSRRQNHFKILVPPTTTSDADVSSTSHSVPSGKKRYRVVGPSKDAPADTKRSPQTISDHLLLSSMVAKQTLPQSDGPTRIPTNLILGQVFDILRYECGQKDRPFGAGMDSLAYFYPRYHSYIARLKLKCGSYDRRPLNLHFGSVDIEKCYDRMNQDCLLRLVQKLVARSNYFVEQLKLDKCEFSRTPARVSSTSTHYKKLVRPLDQYSALHTGRHPLIESSKSTVFDVFKCSVADRAKILALVREHIKSHMVITSGRYQHKILLQTSGISQGSVLSTTLCNLYYGFVEKVMFKSQMNGPCPNDETNSVENENPYSSAEAVDETDDLMARFVDDFIFISPNKCSLWNFLAQTCRGMPDLGAQINPDKSLVSADMTVQVKVNKPSGDINAFAGTTSSSTSFPVCNRKNRRGAVLFPWCGLLFDTETGEVHMDYERFHGGRIRDSLTVDFDGNEGKKMRARMQSFVVPRCLPILYDSTINSFESVVTNFYQMMLLTAAKTAEYIRTQNTHRFASTGKKPSEFTLRNVDYLIKCIHELPTFAHWSIKKILKSLCPSKRRAKFSIQFRLASWLTWEAFYHVFSYLLDFEKLAGRIQSESLPASSSFAKLSQEKAEQIRTVVSKALEDFKLRRIISKNP